jgi:hypothetical protein
VTPWYQWKELSRARVQLTVGSREYAAPLPTTYCRLQGVLSANIASYNCVEHAIHRMQARQENKDHPSMNFGMNHIPVSRLLMCGIGSEFCSMTL